MNFSDLAKMLYSHIGKGQDYPEYVLALIDMVMEDPSDEKGQVDSKNDKYNPLSALSLNLRSKIYNGDRQISKKNAAIIYGRFDKTKLIDTIYALPIDSKNTLCESLLPYGISATSDFVDELCADLLGQILHGLSIGKNFIKTSGEPRIDSKGRRVAEVPMTTAYIQDGKIHIGGEAISLPEQLLPPKDITPSEQPYIEQLLRAYADALGWEPVTKDDVSGLPTRYRVDFSDQRKAYYSAENIEHSVREVFDDGENQFNILKADAHEGIKATYWKDYDNGYARLIAVLEKITSTTLDKSALSQIRNLIGNLEKKGVCHILVNDGAIKSWVAIDD